MRRIDNIDTEIIGEGMDDKEILAYISHIKDKNKEKTLLSLKLTIDGEFVNM